MAWIRERAAFVWPTAYVLAVAWPLVAMSIAGTSERTGALVVLADAVGFLVFTGSVAQVVLVARHRLASATYARLLSVHRLVGWLLVPLALAHVLVLVLDDPGRVGLLDPRTAPPRALAGTAALVSLVLIPTTTIFRRRLRLSYEAWRSVHLVLTAVLIGGAYLHIVLVTNYTANDAFRMALAVLVSVAAISIFVLRALRPFRSLRGRCFRVSEIRDEGARCSTLVLEPEHGGRTPFEPGQFIWIKPATQPLGLSEHPFSIASSGRRSDRMEITVRALGDFTGSVSSIGVGATLLVDGPYGGWRLPDGNRPCCLVAGGVGITPAMSLLRTLADDGDTRDLVLVLGSRSWDDVLFRQELASLRAQLNLRVVHVLAEGCERPDLAIRSSDVRSGMIDARLLAEVAPGEVGDVAWFVCGPPPMVRKVERDLRSLGVCRRAMHLEDYRMA